MALFIAKMWGYSECPSTGCTRCNGYLGSYHTEVEERPVDDRYRDGCTYCGFDYVIETRYEAVPVTAG